MVMVRTLETLLLLEVVYTLLAAPGAIGVLAVIACCWIPAARWLFG